MGAVTIELLVILLYQILRFEILSALLGDVAAEFCTRAFLRGHVRVELG